MKILRIKNLDGWLVYKSKLVPLLKETHEKGWGSHESFSSSIMRIEDFLVQVPDRIRIFIAIENNEVGFVIILMINDINQQYDNNKIFRECHIYSVWAKVGSLLEFFKHAHYVTDYAKDMSCNIITCSSMKKWDILAKRIPEFKLEKRRIVYEIRLDG